MEIQIAKCPERFGFLSFEFVSDLEFRASCLISKGA